GSAPSASAAGRGSRRRRATRACRRGPRGLRPGPRSQAAARGLSGARGALRPTCRFLRSNAVVVVDPRNAARQGTRHLIVDRVGPEGALLGGNPLIPLRADQDCPCPAQAFRTTIGAEIYGDVVHADRPNERIATPANQDVGVV